MNHHFYHEDFNKVIEGFVRERLPIETFLSQPLTASHDHIFPIEPKAAQDVCSDRTLSRNYAFFQFTLLALLGFVVQDPVRGTFEINKAGPLFRVPAPGTGDEPSTGARRDIYLDAMNLFKRILESLANCGFQPHVKELMNQIWAANNNATLSQPSRVALKNTFKSWSYHVLLPIFETPTYKNNAYLWIDTADKLPEQNRKVQPLTEAVLKSNKGEYRLRICKHGLLTVPGMLATERQLAFMCPFYEQESSCGVCDPASEARIVPSEMAF